MGFGKAMAQMTERQYRSALEYIAELSLDERPHAPYPKGPELSEQEQLARLKERADAGDPVAKALLEAPVVEPTAEEIEIFKRAQEGSTGWFCSDHMRLWLARTCARAALLGLGDDKHSSNEIDELWSKRNEETE